jgi:phosphate transport system permease protein
MTPSVLLLAIVAMSVMAFWIGKTRALALVGGTRGIRNLHSLPGHYGFLTAVWAGLPALLILLGWISFQDDIIVRLVSSHLPADVQALPEAQFGLVINDMRNVIAGNIPAAQVAPSTAAAAAEYVK